MSEENTQHIPDGRSFEERVFARFDALEAHLNSRLDKMDARIDGLDARLTSLEEKVDQRLKETRPIWEQMLVRLNGIDARLEGIDAHLEGIDAHLDKFEARLAGLEKNVDYLKRKFRIFNEDILSWQNQQEDVEERLSKLESEAAK